MKKFKSLCLFAFLLLAALVAGCTGHTFDGDAEGDTVSGADGSGRSDTAVAPKATCRDRCGDYNEAAACQCDSECSAAGDCCKDYAAQCGPVCTDVDRDGYCDGSNKDCDDDNPSVHPGATEKNNGIDDDCDGLVDEGFGTDEPTGDNTLTVKYSSSAKRRLNFGVASDKDDIPDVWNFGEWKTASSFTVSFNTEEPDSGCRYVRFNVDEPGDNWFCEGTGSNAKLNADATVRLNILGKEYTSPKKISLGGGCSGIFAVSYGGASCPIP